MGNHMGKERTIILLFVIMMGLVLIDTVKFVDRSLNEPEIGDEAGVPGTNTRTTLKYLVYGDSVTLGEKQLPNVWVDKTASYLNAHAINKGVGGTCLTNYSTYCRKQSPRNGIERYTADIIDQKPDVVAFQYGYNDMYEPVDINAFYLNYTFIVRTVKAALPNASIMIGTLGYETRDSQEDRAKFNAKIAQIAIDNGISIAQIDYVMNHNNSLINNLSNKDDFGVHPNQVGGSVMAAEYNRTYYEHKIQSKANFDYYFAYNDSTTVANWTFNAPSLFFEAGKNSPKTGDWILMRNVTNTTLNILFKTPINNRVDLMITTPMQYTPNAQIKLTDYDLTNTDTRTQYLLTDSNGALTFTIACASASESHNITISYDDITIN
jgi:hypothetical protein